MRPYRVLFWTVDAPEVATVDENGILTAVTNGSVTVKATIDGSGVSGDLEILISNQGGEVLTLDEAVRTFIYPNPVKNGVIHILQEEALSKPGIYDAKGNLIVELPVDKKLIHLPADLIPGVYLLNMTGVKNGDVVHRLIIR